MANHTYKVQVYAKVHGKGRRLALGDVQTITAGGIAAARAYAIARIRVRATSTWSVWSVWSARARMVKAG